MPRRRGHVALFCLAAAALLASAALLARGASPIADREPRPSMRGEAAVGVRDAHSHHDPASEDRRPGRRGSVRLRAARRAALAAARRFLSAFGRYERGASSASVRVRLLEACTDELAAELLASPPRLPLGGVPARARLLWLDAAPLGGPGDELLVTGAQRRGGAIEAIAFRFRLIGGRWLASGVGE